ncbi:MAG: phosphonate C-P lyase system protein PhnG [Pseudomonadota bacterium]
MNEPDQTAPRQRWMSVLARAPEPVLVAVWRATGRDPKFNWIRTPEIGTVMVRGRTGGTGDAFNLGEMTVTRCALQLEGGTTGHAIVSGRSREKAKIAALCDALLQEEAEAEAMFRQVIEPLADAAEQAARDRSAKAAATKVEFFTLARGDS